MPVKLDLFTEFRKARQTSHPEGPSPDAAINQLFYNNIILFNCCTEMKIPLSGGHLGVLPEVCPQSYPQNLWANRFVLCNNGLGDYAKVLSRTGQQASEPA